MCCGSLGQKMLMSPENLSRVRTKFWDMKMLWRRERRYVAIPNMEVWLRLARLAPDVPDGWSFADAEGMLGVMSTIYRSTLELIEDMKKHGLVICARDQLSLALLYNIRYLFTFLLFLYWTI